MAATGEEKERRKKKTTKKEGYNLLGSPSFTDIENGKFRCVETGHELPEKDKENYSESKWCRLGLIDHALSHKIPPLNLFKRDPNSRSKLICKLTGDTVNKSEEHIWKHINGRRFLYRLEQKERGAGSRGRKKKKNGDDDDDDDGKSKSEAADIWMPQKGEEEIGKRYLQREVKCKQLSHTMTTLSSTIYNKKTKILQS